MSLPPLREGERSASSWLADCENLSHVLGVPEARGRIKVCADDFEVEELLGFEPDGEGEHLFVYVEKRGLSTPEAQALLARHFALPPRDVAFSGMKDKQALTRQWFSLHTGSRRAMEQAANAEEWSATTDSGALRILRAVPNSRKLRRGSHRQNRFHIRIRALQADREQLLARLAAVVEYGVANYFGPQRFGYGASTLLQALAAGARKAPGKRRHARGMQLSAARSFLFNQVLSRRVAAQTWDRAQPGDVVQLAGTASVFAASREQASTLEQRLRSFDVHLTGPLWGRGELPCSDDVAKLEQAVVAQYPELSGLLEAAGLQQERRALRMQVQDCQHEFVDGSLLLTFTLGRGCYATSLLRELLQTEPVVNDPGVDIES